MEKRPTVQTLLTIAGILTLALVAFFAGRLVLSSAHSARMSKSSQQGTPGTANTVKGTVTVNNGASYGAKGTVTVNSITGNTIKATVSELLPNFTKNSAVTITTTASTIYDPDKSVVAPGKTIYVAATVNQDGSLTASYISSNVPTRGG